MNWDSAYVLTKYLLLVAFEIVFAISSAVYLFLIWFYAADTATNVHFLHAFFIPPQLVGLMAIVPPFLMGLLAHRWIRSVLTAKVLSEVFEEEK